MQDVLDNPHLEEKISAHNIISHKLKDEIEFFSRNKLRKKQVYLVGGPPETYLPNGLHSFSAVGAVKTRNHEASYCSLRYLTASIMHGHYRVRKTIVTEVMKSSNFTAGTKAAVQKLQGQTFPSVE